MPPEPPNAFPGSKALLAAHFNSEHRAETVNPEPHRLMTDVDPELVQQVLDVPV